MILGGRLFWDPLGSWPLLAPPNLFPTTSGNDSGSFWVTRTSWSVMFGSGFHWFSLWVLMVIVVSLWMLMVVVVSLWVVNYGFRYGCHYGSSHLATRSWWRMINYWLVQVSELLRFQLALIYHSKLIDRSCTCQQWLKKYILHDYLRYTCKCVIEYVYIHTCAYTAMAKNGDGSFQGDPQIWNGLDHMRFVGMERMWPMPEPYLKMWALHIYHIS